MSFSSGGEFEMIETIQQLKEDIALLQMKLQKLEELQRTKSPVEEAYKRWMGEYPSTTPSVDNTDDIRWRAFQMGYNASKVGEYQPTPQEPEDNEWKTVALGFGENLSAIGPCGYYDFTPVEWYEWVLNAYEKTADDYLRLLKKGKGKEQKWDVVRESVKWCEENPEKSVEDYLKPHTPEQTDKLLREAFQKVQQTEEWKETQRKIDGKNPLEFLKFELGKTLEGLIEEWWCDVFTRNSDLSMEESIDCLVSMISNWLPKSQSAAGSQSLGVEDMVEGFNDCLKKIKSKLRNKK